MRHLLFTTMLFLSACASSPQKSPTGLQLMSDSEYESVIEKSSNSKELYDGLYNTINVRATILRKEVTEAIMQRNAVLYQWDRAKFDEESSKNLQKISKESEVFISLYTPERKHDDLHKNKTLWKIFLDVNGKRYEGKAAKIKLLTTEVQAFYPAHNTFSTPYLVSFPVAATSLDGSPAKLTLTGPITSVSLDL